MGGAEGTKLDLDFMDMERKTDVTNELVEEIQVKTKEFLQPNPTARAKMAAVKGISKLSGQAKSNTYPQPEGLLADCMLMYGKKLGDNSIFGRYQYSVCIAHTTYMHFIEIEYAFTKKISSHRIKLKHLWKWAKHYDKWLM